MISNDKIRPVKFLIIELFKGFKFFIVEVYTNDYQIKYTIELRNSGKYISGIVLVRNLFRVNENSFFNSIEDALNHYEYFTKNNKVFP
jgi:hypothetical protein